MYKIVFKKDPETGKTQKVMVPVTSETEYRNLRDSKNNLDVQARVRRMYDDHRRMAAEHATAEELKQHKDLIDQEKRGLLEMNYSCIPGPDMLLKGSTQLSPWVGSDVDFDPTSPNFQQLMDEAPQRIIGMAEQLGLGMLERSAGKGYHAVFRRHQDMTQEENLQWFSSMIGCAFDERAKDITRVFYTTSAAPEDLLYLSPEMFAPEANIPVVVTATAEKPQQTKPAASSTTATSGQLAAAISPDPKAHTYMGHTFQEIIDKYWELFNDGKTPCDGARNTLTYELALNLRCIRDFDLEKLLAVIPIYDGLPVDEWRQAITNANNETRKGMTYRMRRVLEALRKNSQQSTMPWGMNAATPPLYTGRMPEPLRKITSTTPQHLKSTVSEGVFGALATHLHGVTFQLIDGKITEPAIMQILIYRQSRGKGSIDDPIEEINADLLAHDIIDRERDGEYKRNNPANGKKKQPRPEDIYWQCCQSDMTNAAFVQRLIDCGRNGGRPVFLKMEELDELTALSTNGKQDVSRIIRKAFDRKNYGQERVSSESVSGMTPLRLNFTAATTPIRAREMCLPWVSDGTLSRCNLLTIDPSEKKPKYKLITQKYRNEIAPYIARLNEATGLIRCKKAEQLAERLRDELDDKYAETGSESLNIFASRAVTIAYWKAMILYIMMGKWSADIESYIEWSLRRDIWVKLHFFGEKMEADIQEEENMRTFHPRSILDGMQSPFREAEFIERRKLYGCKGDYKEHLKKLRQRGKIAYYDTINMYVIVKKEK